MARYHLRAAPSAQTLPELAEGTRGPDFSIAVPDNGYAWWYLDALSDDGQEGLTLIAFIGSVFSPYYAAARRSSQPIPAARHVALNVALYRPGRSGRWAMTERDDRSLARDRQHYVLAGSSLHWHNDQLIIELDERCTPFAQPLKGRIRVSPQALNETALVLNGDGDHRWQALAPAARIELELNSPVLRWSGTAYVDHNRGNSPLESGFDYWTWSRQHRPTTGGQRTEVLYDYVQRGGDHGAARVSFAPDGALAVDQQLPATQVLATPLWRVGRSTRLANARILRDFEDTPFYTRTLLGNEHGPAICECLDLRRFGSRWVQTLLPFRMPRITGRPPRPIAPNPA